MEPVLIPFWPDGCKAIGIGKTRGFELLAMGLIETVKVGRKRMVQPEALRRYVEQLVAEQLDDQPQPAA